MPTPHRNARKKLPKEKPALSPEEQEAEDVQIAGFYQNDGNFKAAYQRAREAVGLVADDPEAHLALANAARKLGKLDEAKSSYQKALALDPVPKIRRVAERALKEMSGS